MRELKYGDFVKWAKRWCRKFRSDNYYDYLDYYRSKIGYNRLTPRPIIVINKQTGKTAIAKCNPKDNFNLEVGIGIAYARCRGAEVPKVKVDRIFKSVDELKPGDKFMFMRSDYKEDHTVIECNYNYGTVTDEIFYFRSMATHVIDGITKYVLCSRTVSDNNILFFAVPFNETKSMFVEVVK